MVQAPPGPRARALSERLRRFEAPGINTLYGGAPNILWAEARGANVIDVDGNRYVDLTSGFGVAAVGHRHPRVVEAVGRQASRLLHGLGDAAAHPLRVELAERLVERTAVAGGGRPRQVHFAVSGADAVEVAVKTALLARPERSRILTFEPSYHGLTLGALAASSRPAFRRPFVAHLHRSIDRLPFGGPIADLKAALEPLLRGGVAAALVEPIVGREGVLVPPAGWLAALAAACARHDVLLIADEVFTGGGRTGRLWASDLAGVAPDLICCGKALGGGLPIAAVVGDAEVLAAWTTPGEALHTGTFVAHPVACAAALATLDVLEDEGLVERAAAFEPRLAGRLGTWPGQFAQVLEVRGRGMLWGIELETAEDAAALVDGARRRGVLCLAGGPEGRVAQIVPPLTIDEGQLGLALDLLEETLGGAAAAAGPAAPTPG